MGELTAPRETGGTTQSMTKVNLAEIQSMAATATMSANQYKVKLGIPPTEAEIKALFLYQPARPQNGKSDTPQSVT